jgi:hypothetical protein
VSRHSSRTNAERQRRKRDKATARGLAQCNVLAPRRVHPDLRLQAEIIQQHPHLVPGPLRDPVSGKYVALRSNNVRRSVHRL